MKKLAAEQGRTVRFGIRLHVIVRETESEAWEDANRLIQYVDEDAIAAAQKAYARMDSEGQRRMTELHTGSRDALEISPNLWAGIGLVRGGAGTALVGDPDTVVARMLEYSELGIETFIFSGYPHLEEAYRVAELLFPRLPLKNQPTVHQLKNSTHTPCTMPQVFNWVKIDVFAETVSSIYFNKLPEMLTIYRL